MEPHVNSFGPVAPYYDDLMKTVPYRMWVGYYLLLMSYQDVHPRTILDVCCGTGTMCFMLQNEGFKPSGFDLAPGMIEAARAKAAKRKVDIPFEVMDASTFEFGVTFDAVFSFFDSLNNITDPARLQMAFDRVYDHLTPGGSWIFDMNTEFAFKERLFDQTYLRKNAKLRYKWVGDYDDESRIITVDMLFYYEDQEFTETHRQRAYNTDEVIAMLQKSGFESIQTFHSYTLEHPRRTSDRIHFAAIKPKV